jgi:DNA-binding NarL/FixJ family response regulator
VRVLVADSDSRVRAALNMFFRSDSGSEIIGESKDASSLLAQAKEIQPDLVLIDWELPGNSIATLIEWLKEAEKPSKVIVLSRRPESEQAALTVGADAFVSKTHSANKLLDTLHRLFKPEERDIVMFPQ